MAREDKPVTRTLPKGYPNVTPTFTVGQALVAPTSLPRAHLHPACLARAPLAKCSFFRAKKKCVHVFFARRGDCRNIWFSLFSLQGLRKGSRPPTDPKMPFPYWKNDYLVAKIGVDTDENEPRKGSKKCML